MGKQSLNKARQTLSPRAQQVIDQRNSYFYPCTAHFYKRPPLLVRGQMQYVYDDEGNRYTDLFAGVSVIACGHCNETITSETVEQLRTLQHTCTIYLTDPNARLAQRLASVLPGALKRSFFCNSGSEANEGALLLARLHTRRSGFIALEHSLHGRTYLTMSVTGLSMWRADPYLTRDEDVSFIPRPYDPAMSPDEAAERSIAALRKVLEIRGDKIAAMIVEPIQGNGGIIAPPLWYYREVKRLLETYGVLLIADEVQSGFGRTGKMFAIEHYGVVPDVITMGKALGNGVPISSFSTTDEIAASFTKPSASTFGGNPVASVTALAVLDYIEQEGLMERASRLGERLMGHLHRLRESYSVISEVRGIGLMVGLELKTDRPAQTAELVDEILEQMKDRGFLLGKNGVGRDVVVFQPPLIIEEADIEAMISALQDVLAGLKVE
jgi:alanine-glyoxylate transaminase / (R)-3-amino-2-methylpropionate-pyruvate transaminase